MSAIANRLRKSWDKLKPWASKLEIEAFRLYDRDIPEYPFIIEIFGTSAVLWDRRDDQIDQGKEQNFTDAISGITELGIPRENIVIKRRQRQAPRASEAAVLAGPRGPSPITPLARPAPSGKPSPIRANSIPAPKEDSHDDFGDDEERDAEVEAESSLDGGAAANRELAPAKRDVRLRGRQHNRLSRNSPELTVREGAHKFLVNLHDYLDTGLFLDHRLTRKLVADHIQKRTAGHLKTRFLNLFCYTGSFSVYAARAGATVTSVDMSGNYLAWAERNFIANGLMTSNHRFINEDVLTWTKSGNARNTGPYEFIFCDPPTFSNSKKMEGTWEVQRDHAWLIQQCLDALTPDGVLIFSANRRDFKLDEMFDDLEDYKVRELTRDTLPRDFHDAKARRVFLFS
jgi:23S rRNA (cytosine1962-C5)-methyltransferase